MFSILFGKSGEESLDASVRRSKLKQWNKQLDELEENNQRHCGDSKRKRGPEMHRQGRHTTHGHDGDKKTRPIQTISNLGILATFAKWRHLGEATGEGS